MPASDFDGIDPAFITAQIEAVSAELDSQLRKRYEAPFVAPYPLILGLWLPLIITPELFYKRGWNPSDEQNDGILKGAERARAQVQQAADCVTGLFDLPLRREGGATGITKGGPRSYSEQSPYEWLDVQREAVRYGR